MSDLKFYAIGIFQLPKGRALLASIWGSATPLDQRSTKPWRFV